MYSRKLAAFLDLSLQVSLFVLQVLKAEVCLVHVMSCIGRGLFVCACGRIGGTVQSLKTCKESSGMYVDVVVGAT